jgi:hypothetical protein
MEAAFRVLARHPGAEATARAWLVTGFVAGRRAAYGEALHRLGRASAEGRESDEAASARRLASLVDRLAHRADAPGFLALVAEPAVTLPEGASAMEAADDGTLHVLLERGAGIVVVGPGGETSRQPAGEALSLALDEWGRVFLGGEGSLSKPAGSPLAGLPEGAEAIDLVVAGARRAYVADEDEDRVLIVTDQGSTTAAGLPSRARPERLAPAPPAGVWVLETREARLVRLDREGQRVTTIALERFAEEPVDVDTDVLGNLYVLDEEGALIVLREDGRLVARVALPEEGPRAVERPGRLAVDEAGRVAVYDDRTETIRWLR